MQSKPRTFVSAESFDAALGFKKKLIIALDTTIHSENTHHQKPYIEKPNEIKTSLLNLLQRVIMTSISEAMEERDVIHMYKLGKLAIKKGNLIAQDVKDEIAKDMGFDKYSSADRHSRVEIRIKATEEIRSKKLFRNKTKRKVNSSPTIHLNFNTHK